MLFGSSPELKKSLISRETAGPTVLEFIRKNPAENLSGLCALSGWIENIAALISSSAGTADTPSLSSSVMDGEITSSTIHVASELFNLNRDSK